MSNISKISFLAETAGSPAYLLQGAKADTPLVERTTPRETTGSPAYSKLGALNAQWNYDTVSFRGETSGSPAYSVCPDGNCSSEAPKKNDVSFRSRNVSHQKEKSASPFAYLAIAGGIAATAIAGMGYAQKSGTINKMKDGTIKDIVEPVTKKCYDWCHTIKSKTIGLKKKYF